ncbi:hypothetical protein HDU98_007831, partial [Podochytrium sp. JEL0797]
CGAFNGNPELKALIQLLAAAAARRELVYFTFGDQDLCVKLVTLGQMMMTSQVTVGNVFQLIVSFKEVREGDDASVIEFILAAIDLP